jgi:hypothetical protein
MENFLTIQATMTFLRRTLLYGLSLMQMACTGTWPRQLFLSVNTAAVDCAIKNKIFKGIILFYSI